MFRTEICVDGTFSNSYKSTLTLLTVIENACTLSKFTYVQRHYNDNHSKKARCGLRSFGSRNVQLKVQICYSKIVLNSKKSDYHFHHRQPEHLLPSVPLSSDSYYI